MDKVSTLRKCGLFDAKVPRYTSYPPANRFEAGVGEQVQTDWLSNVPADQPVSVYAHIPFCRRLCWFCACRTQGTKTLAPVRDYLDTLLNEIDAVSKTHLSRCQPMARLHLGGGTPTLLSPPLMRRLLDHFDTAFARTEDFEFSVEIDPTEAERDVLQVLFDKGMTRASIGVQDFDPKVQKAIGRIQGFDVTRDVISTLRGNGVQSLNIDFLYGLPFQTKDSLIRTIDLVAALRPDRLALYGYAHVPHMSKRQVMIPDALPDPEQRYVMAQIAKERLVALGYVAIGIDHFALPDDSLTIASRSGGLARNFQGYTDDPCQTLIGFGASAISRFPEGYVHNAVSTSAYHQRIKSKGVAGHKGIALMPHDHFIAHLIDGLMCRGEIKSADVLERFPNHSHDLQRHIDGLMTRFPDLMVRDEGGIAIKEDLAVSARLVAAHLDQMSAENSIHSLAV